MAQQHMETPSAYVEDLQKKDDRGNELPVKPNELLYGLGQPWGGNVPHHGGHHGINLYWVLPCWTDFHRPIWKAFEGNYSVTSASGVNDHRLSVGQTVQVNHLQ